MKAISVVWELAAPFIAAMLYVVYLAVQSFFGWIGGLSVASLSGRWGDDVQLEPHAELLFLPTGPFDVAGLGNRLRGLLSRF